MPLFNNPKILLIATNHVGNNLFCTPAIRFLKKHLPTTEFDVLVTSSRGKDVFIGNSDIHQIYNARSLFRIRKILRRYKFVIGLHKDISKNCLRGLNIPNVIVEPNANLHRAENILLFVSKLLNQPILPEDRRYVIANNSIHDFEARSLLAVGINSPMVGIHLGSGRTSTHGWKFWYNKRACDPRLWQLENYVELAKRLTTVHPELKIVLTGSKHERFLGKKFAKLHPGVINLISKTSLQTLAAAMKYFKVFITHDTGVLHVACATDVPTTSLFGSTDPTITGPYPACERHTILQAATLSKITPESVASTALTHF